MKKRNIHMKNATGLIDIRGGNAYNEKTEANPFFVRLRAEKGGFS